MTIMCWRFIASADSGGVLRNRILPGCDFARLSIARCANWLSYFEHYYNLRGERTLRAYSVPVNLARLDEKNWMAAEEDVWCVTDLLVDARHYALVPDKVTRKLPRVDRRSFESGMHGWLKH